MKLGFESEKDSIPFTRPVAVGVWMIWCIIGDVDLALTFSRERTQTQPLMTAYVNGLNYFLYF